MRCRNVITTFVALLCSALLGATEKIELRDMPPIGLNTPSLKTYANRPFVLTFWAVWCTPCAAELRQLEQFYRSHHVPVVGIAIDSTAKQAARMIEKTGVSFSNYLDTSSEMADTLGVSGVPTLCVVDTHGKVLWSRTGYSVFPEKELKQQLEKLNKKK